MLDMTFPDLIDLLVLFVSYFAFYKLGKVRSDWVTSEHLNCMIRMHADEISELRKKEIKCCECENKSVLNVLHHGQNENVFKRYCSVHMPKIY